MARRAFHDWIGLLETAYVLDGTVEDWMETLTDKLDPALEEGLGIATALFEVSPPHLIVKHAVEHRQRITGAVSKFVSALPWPAIESMLNHSSPARTTSEVVYPIDRTHPALVKQLLHGQDILVIVCNSLGGQVFMIGTPLPRQRGVMPLERLRLNRVAAHLGSGLRLRSHLTSLDLDDGDSTEAIFNPDGKIMDARGLAAPKSARERLRQAVLQSERARGPLRRKDPGEALSLWEALVEGRWSLVDHYDSDDRRMVVAVQNEPGVHDPRGLTPLQFRIAEYLGQGRPAKEIGYTLGVTASAVNNALAVVKKKLGLCSRAEVAAFFAPGGVRSGLTRVDIGQEALLVGGYGGCNRDTLAPLTEAEQAVALLLLQGATNREVARRRHSSYNTVANQIKAIYAKLGVRNRAELAALAEA